MMRINRRHTHKQAFTLVELLVVMAVLTLLSSLVLSALSGAAEQARENRTRSQIQKIHELLMSRYEDYRYRRVPPRKTGNVRARQGDRVDKIRELMRMEMPDHISDLELFEETGNRDGYVIHPAPALFNRYRRAAMRRTGTASWVAAKGQWSETHESSECLYLILESMQDGDTNGLDFFRESEIGDLDGDGMPEILDGWGRPILFIRWPAGFPFLDRTTDFRAAQSNLHNLSSPDPFDPLGVRDGRLKVSETPLIYSHFPLYPLVFSAGPDGLYNIRVGMDDMLGGGEDYQAMLTTPPNNPYAASTNNERLGSFLDDSAEHLDNITNHQLIIGGNE